MKTKVKNKTGLKILAIAVASICFVALFLGAAILGASSSAKLNNSQYYDGELNAFHSNSYSMNLWDNLSASNVSASNALETTSSEGNVLYNDNGERMIIANARLYMQTKTYDALLAAMKEELKTLGGYMDSYDEHNYDSNRQVELVARVPSEKLDVFLASLEKNGTVTSRSEIAADVTNEMIETGSKREALKAEETALLAVLEKADTVEDIIRVQDRLSEVRSEKESYEKKLQQLSNQVNYATVYLTVNEVDRITTPTQSFGSLAGSGFVNSLKNIGSGLRNFAIWFIAAIPYLVLIAIPVTVLAILGKRAWKNKKAKKAASAEN